MSWTPVDTWVGAGQYPGFPTRCPRCGSTDTKRGEGDRTSKTLTFLSTCEQCGLTFKTIANAEPLDEGCYDTEAVIEVQQSDIDG